MGSLLLTAVWRGLRRATEVSDKVRGLVYTEPAVGTFADPEVDIYSLTKKSEFHQMVRSESQTLK